MEPATYTFISPAPPSAVREVWEWAQTTECRRALDDFTRPQDFDGFKKLLDQNRISNAFMVDGEAAGICLVRIVNRVTAECGFMFRSWSESWCEDAIRRSFNAIFETGFGRIQLVVFADDRHSINAFERAGGRVEGTLKRFTMRDQKRVDGKWVALLKEEFYRSVVN